MSIFSSILSKLGFGDKQVEVAAAAPAATAAPAAPAAPVAAAPVAISEVDVVAKLTTLAAAHAEKLNWKTSIVDLLKLLGLDSSLAVRKDKAHLRSQSLQTVRHIRQGGALLCNRGQAVAGQRCQPGKRWIVQIIGQCMAHQFFQQAT